MQISQVFNVMYNNSHVRKITFKCILLNGILFLGSIFCFEYIFRPLLIYFSNDKSIFTLYDEILNSFFLNTMLVLIGFQDKTVLITKFTNNNNNNNITMLNNVVKTTQSFESASFYIFTFLQYFCWLYPIYIISIVLNNFWYNDIAKYSYNMQYKKEENKISRPKEMIQDAIYKTLLLNVMWIEFFIIGMISSFFLCCWIYSFSLFEYRWQNSILNLFSRIDIVEQNASYFLGFGFPITCATFFFPTLVSVGILAVLYPFFIIISNKSKPSHPESVNPSHPESANPSHPESAKPSLKIFHARYLIEYLIIFFLEKKYPRKQKY